MSAPMESEDGFRAFVEEYRARCLWFLEPGFMPMTQDERERVLRLIEQHGDHAAFRRAAAFRQWLSLPSSARSAAS